MDNTREETEYSPYGLHMRNYKACSLVDVLEEVIVNLINIPFRHGFTFPRCNESIHHMMEKKPGNFSIKKMRIIQLVEAEFNTYQKIKIGKHFMQRVEKWITSHRRCMEGEKEGQSTILSCNNNLYTIL